MPQSRLTRLTIERAAAIIELGFMLADRDLLVNRQEDMARGITDGVLCYLSPPV